ncbi:plasmid mobilization protein [Arcticibacter tournemirensis]|uniref:MobC family plasmid mobilization relaxosome protein n=1 Tax=Arcticibacter tournemirensis TaxID=699437 RepID=A0A4Q0M546_9SPHI|nr:plasmid mobilization relaxosome protein MobC [Arcticibacter tournemirensis]RXF67913.1 MobC family plasmid mobilization relaxosome protein [Arcticibacter tournemirensis]
MFEGGKVMKVQAIEKETNHKKRMRGRPRKAITRNASLVVRLTPTERLVISGKAKQAGMRITEWFRTSAKNAVIKPRFSKEDAAYLRTLSGMANNLNQLTRLAHTNGLVSLIADLRMLLLKVEELMKRIGSHDS